MLISLCLETDKKYSDKQMITDIHSWSLTHSWEKSQCKKYLSYYFLLLIADLIRLMLKIIVNLSVISSKWLEIWVLRKGQKRELALFYYAPGSFCKPASWTWQLTCNWLWKITRSFGSGFQKQRLQSQMSDWSWLRAKVQSRYLCQII